MFNHIEGDAPRVCLWETGPEMCAPIQSMPVNGGWSTYRATVLPDAGTTGLTVYLYADTRLRGVRTVNQYADVRLVEIPLVPRLATTGIGTRRFRSQ